MDRLDTWLNAQRGWRRLGLLLLQNGPPLVVFAIACFGLFLDRLPSDGFDLAGIIALGVVVAVMLSLFDAWRGRNGRGKRPLRLTWRAIAYTPVMMSPFLLIVLTFNASPAWQQQHHHATDIALLIIVPCMLIVTFERSRHEMRLRGRQNYYNS